MKNLAPKLFIAFIVLVSNNLCAQIITSNYKYKIRQKLMLNNNTPINGYDVNNPVLACVFNISEVGVDEISNRQKYGYWKSSHGNNPSVQNGYCSSSGNVFEYSIGNDVKVSTLYDRVVTSDNALYLNTLITYSDCYYPHNLMPTYQSRSPNRETNDANYGTFKGSIMDGSYYGCYFVGYGIGGSRGVNLNYINNLEFLRLQNLSDVNNLIGNDEIGECTDINLNVLENREDMTFALEATLDLSDPIRWTEILPYNKRSSKDIPISFAYLKSKLPLLTLNKNIFIRARYTETGAGPEDHSDALDYKFILCAPKLAVATPNLTLESPICNGDISGKAIFTFEEPIAIGDKFKFSATRDVLYTVSSHYPDLTNPNETNTDILIISQDRKSCEWKNMTAGKYTNVWYSKSRFISPTLEVFSMPGIAPDFTITSPDPVQFTLNPINPQCKDESGKITIIATGGTGNYRYFLDNSTTATPFVNSTTIHPITKIHSASQTIDLPTIAGGIETLSHTIKVIDEKGCEEK
jgi:SprB repeat